VRIVVTGATGFIGRPLVRRLLDAGHDVTALSRDVAGAVRQLPARCPVRRWDATGALDPGTLRDSDAVIHLAGEGIADQRWTAARKLAIAGSRVDGSRRLLAALGALAPDERPHTLVAASAIGYYGERGDEWLDEDAGPSTGYLAQVCRDWERETAVGADLGIRTVALRIGVVLGRDGGAFAKLLPPFRAGVGGRVGSGRQWMSWIHLEDMVRLLEFAVVTPGARGPINGVAPNPVTNPEFTRELGRVLHRPTIFPVPAFALRLALGEMSTVLLASQRVRPARALALGFTFRHGDAAGALADLCRDPGHELVREQWVPRRPEEVFPFFADPMNLERLTPPFLHFRVLRSSTPALGEGTAIDYRLRLHGLPVRWQSRIERWEPSRGFVDRQVRGPYRLWQHTHEFEPWHDGTIVRDRVRFALPLAPLGDLVAGALVEHDLDRIFDFRREKIHELFGGA